MTGPMMTVFRPFLILLLALACTDAGAQDATDKALQDAILAALPDGVGPEAASADQVARAALDVLFSVEANMQEREDRARGIMVALGELTRAGTFESAPRYGSNNPPARFFSKVLNLASSALDVTYTTYHGVTVQHIIGLTAAMREGQNILNGASSNAITRK